jgi:hypothetical protein
MKWLVVTADELGLSSKRNQGIVDAHCKGIVTSASMLPYGPAFREAVKIAKALPKLDIGVHLNLSDGEPLVLGHKTLVGPDGKFWAAEARAGPASPSFDLREVEREVDAQIDTVKSAASGHPRERGRPPAHPGQPRPVGLDRREKHGIRCFRCPADRCARVAPLDPDAAGGRAGVPPVGDQRDRIYARSG